jgi:hypothetical protein
MKGAKIVEVVKNYTKINLESGIYTFNIQ